MMESPSVIRPDFKELPHLVEAQCEGLGAQGRKEILHARQIQPAARGQFVTNR